MAETLSLFPEPEPDETEPGLKAELAVRLRRLADQGIYIGSSSWKYEGWQDSIYTRRRYLTNGRFSKKKFDAECLLEYAEAFPIVCGDFAFYQFPSREFWQKLFAQAPQNFLFGFKAPEELTRPRFPSHPRYGAKAGSVNQSFLNADMFLSQFTDLLTPYADRVAIIMLEFGPLPSKLFATPEKFAAALAPFLQALPKTFRFAIEIRNAELFHPDYMAVLRENNVAHVFNAWTAMPPLPVQMELEAAFTTGFTAARALLTPGREYEESRALFLPFSEVRQPNQHVRDALRQLLIRAKLRHEPTYIFINNRIEGFAPGTALAITEGM